ncbi:MAG TPA: DUF1697 domain-containing protein [Leeuwenhoekiella sp.]|nr:DUF1697 domain-containing protein [Leeuwenhoekiella sp.]
MSNYIAILRGINVGGHRKIPMEGLRKEIGNLGYKNIKTYIQSGNIIFTAAAHHSDLEIAEHIEKMILTTFGFEVPVIVRNSDELQQTVSENPFLTTENTSIEGLHVTFLKETPSPETLENIKTYTYPPDKFEIRQKNVFLYIPGSYHKTKLSNAFFEKKLNVQATTRNWKTVQKLAEMSDF